MGQCLNEQHSVSVASFANENVSRDSEFTQDVFGGTLVMPRSVSLPVGQIGKRELFAVRGEVVNARQPQRLDVREVAGMLLR